MNRVSYPSSITSADAYIRHKTDRRVRLALGESAALYPSSSCNAGHPPGAWSPSLALLLLMLAGYGWSSGRGGRRSKLLLLQSILQNGTNCRMERLPQTALPTDSVGANRHKADQHRQARGHSSSILLLSVFLRSKRGLLVIPPPAAYCSRSRVFALAT